MIIPTHEKRKVGGDQKDEALHIALAIAAAAPRSAATSASLMPPPPSPPPSPLPEEAAAVAAAFAGQRALVADVTDDGEAGLDPTQATLWRPGARLEFASKPP